MFTRQNGVTGATLRLNIKRGFSGLTNSGAFLRSCKVILVSWVMLVVVSGCSLSDWTQQPPGRPDVPVQGGASRSAQYNAIINAPYRIQPGDTLSLRFFGSPDLDQQMLVQPDGSIDLPLLGMRRVTDMRMRDLSDALQDLYTSELRRPEVILQLVQTAPTAVYVGGAVRQAGQFDYRRGMSVLDALLGAGWLAEDARKANVIVIRKLANGGRRHKEVSLDALLGNGGSNEVLLLPWDIVYVPFERHGA